MHFLSVKSLAPIITLISVALARSAHSAKHNNTLPAYPVGGHNHVNTTISWSGGKVKEGEKITVVTVVIKKPVTTICVTKTSGSESGVVQTYTTYTGAGPGSSKPSSPNNAGYTTSTILSTLTYTITSCAPIVTKCPVGLVTQTVYTYTTVCPISGSASNSLSSAPYKNVSTAATEISTGSGTVTLSSSSGSVTLAISSSLSSESTSLLVSETVSSSKGTLSTSESVVVSRTSSASSDIPTSSSVTSDLPTSSILSSSLSSSTSESSSSEITSSDVPSSTSEVLSSSSTYSSFASSLEELSSSATTSSELSPSSVYSSALSSTTEASSSEITSSDVPISTSEVLPSSSIYTSVASSMLELSSSEVASSVSSSSASLISSETSSLVINTSSTVLSSSSEIATPTSTSGTSDVVSSSSIVVIETTSSSSTPSLVSSTIEVSSSSSTLSSTFLTLSSSSIIIVSSTGSSDLPSSTSIIATTSSSSSMVLSSSSFSITPTTSNLSSSTSVLSSSSDSSSTSVSSVRSFTSYSSSPSSSTRACVGRCVDKVDPTPSSSLLNSSSKSTALSSSTSPISSTSSSARSSLSSSLSSSTLSSNSLTSSSQTSSLSSSSSITSSSSSKISGTSSSTSSSATPTPTLPACYYWMEEFKHQGIAPFAATPGTYQVFRNVKDFGAKGDGVTDDTAAINLAISTGGRCASDQCESTTTTPAIVYFPSGTYLVSSPVIDYYYTQMIGNPNCMPVIKASQSFTGRWVVDADVYGAAGLGYGATNVFWRQMRNFVIDTTSVPVGREIAGIHWPTAQATSLQNMVFKMSGATGTMHEGVFSESGSGGFMTDLVFHGGLHGCLFANQQFTMRNLTFYNAVTAISQAFDWGWTYKGLSINNCGTGIDMTSLSVGSITLIDSIFLNTPVAISTSKNSTSSPPLANTLIIENVQFTNVQSIVTGSGGTPLLPGSAGSITVTGWGQGHSYSGTTGPSNVQGSITPNVRTGLTAGADFYERSKPQYEKLPTSQFVSVRDAGAKGDGVTDDSDVLNSIIAAVALAGKIVFFDAGDYVVTKPIYIPAGSRITGEAYPVILSSGAYFNDINNPKPVVQVGKSGETGNVEWSDMIVSTRGAQAGAILIEWNLASTGTPAGMWDVHTRIGGFAGSNLQLADCPKTPDTVITSATVPSQCIAAFMSMHITARVTGLYMENVWLWVADHDVEDASVTQITVYAGRGLLIESNLGAIWLYGTASEHHTLYQYQLTNTANIFMGHIQTETAYYQPNPSTLIPFPANAAYSDPIMAAGASGWALRVVNSKQVLVYGAGLYSFFNNYNVHCSDQGNGSTCQQRIMSVENSKVSVYGLATIGSVVMYTQDGVDGALSAANEAGFATSVMLYRS